MARRCLCAACDSGTALQDARQEKNSREQKKKDGRQQQCRKGERLASATQASCRRRAGVRAAVASETVKREGFNRLEDLKKSRRVSGD